MIRHTRATFQPKSRSKPFNAQSYEHMMGQITTPQDHPAYNMPDPAGATLSSANPPSPDESDMADMQGTY